jgi:hypothetical protein
LSVGMMTSESSDTPNAPPMVRAYMAAVLSPRPTVFGGVVLHLTARGEHAEAMPKPATNPPRQRMKARVD